MRAFLPGLRGSARGWFCPGTVASLALVAASCLPAAAPVGHEIAQAVAATAPGPAAAPPQLVIPEGALAGPDFTVERATEAYLAQLTPEQRARSDAYFEGGYWLQLWQFLYGLLVAWLILGTRISARMADWAERRTRSRTLQVVLYAAAFVVVDAVLNLPMVYYAECIREHRYGMSNQSVGEWFTEAAKALALGLVFAPLAIAVLYAVFRRSPRAWWLWGTGVGVLFLAFAVAIAPVFVAPLFNDYRPLPPGPVRASVLSLARANGVPADEVYWFDASRQSKRISANVSGLFGTMRISLNDNLLNRTPPEGVEAVMAHELGHYVLNHIPRHLVSFGLLLLLGMGLVAWAFPRIVAWRGRSWGVRGVADPAGLPLLGALFSIFIFLATPVTNTLIRTAELEADIFGLNAARQPDGFATVALHLGEYRKLRPGPIEEAIFFDHPSGETRIRMAMRWKQEQMARPSTGR